MPTFEEKEKIYNDAMALHFTGNEMVYLVAPSGSGDGPPTWMAESDIGRSYVKSD